MNERDIRRLIEIIEETGIDEIEVRRWWGGKIRVTKRAAGGSATAPGFAAPAAGAPSAHPEASAAGTAAPPVPDTDVLQFSDESHYIIRSPIVGTFYRAPAPDAPPYVETGDTIKAGQVVCIVEAMKLMNEIQAEKGGKIIKILIENAQPVEYNQMMIVLEPEL
jgi:acetyl-CoA carboxylase biotin carboxyl carrier protein